MRFLESFVETRIAGAIGWTLLHSLWQGAIVSVVFAAVLLAIRSPGCDTPPLAPRCS